MVGAPLDTVSVIVSVRATVPTGLIASTVPAFWSEGCSTTRTDVNPARLRVLRAVVTSLPT